MTSSIHAICLDSMRAVLDGDVEYQIRRILRWYSREFHTPLHVVEDLPLDDVLRAYWESAFENLKPKERLKRAKTLTLTAAERAERERVKDEANQSDDEFEAAILEREAKKRQPPKKLAPAPAMQDLPRKLTLEDVPEVEMSFDDNLPNTAPEGG